MMLNDKDQDVIDDFPIFSKYKGAQHHLIYFDSAATTQKPLRVINRMSDFYLYEYGTVHRAIYQLAAEATEKYSLAREKIRDFIGARSEQEIIFTSGTTDSINLVARSFGLAFLKEGDEVLISHAEHHANIVPWQMLAQEKNIIVKVIPILNDGAFDLVSFQKMLSSKVKLVSVAYVANTTGAVYPVKEIVKLSHDIGAKVLIDGAQAVGHFPINVKELDVDFFAFSGHKMYGPTGIGILYGKYELLEKLPPHKGGGDMIEKVTFEKTIYQNPPLRFEAGTPMIAEAIGLASAIDYLQSLGLQKIHEFEEKLRFYATKKLSELPEVHIIGETKEKGPIITFTIKGLHPLDVGTILNLKGVAVRTGQMCAEPLLNRFGLLSAIRISFGIYNSTDEIDQFMKMLKETIILLKPEVSY